MASVKNCLTISFVALSMLLSSRSYAGFIIKDPAQIHAQVHKQTIKTTIAHWYEWLNLGPAYSGGDAWHVILGTLSYLAGLAAICMVIIGGISFFIVTAVPTVTASILLFGGGFCIGIMAIILAHYSQNGGGYVGGWLGVIAVCIAIFPFMLVYWMGLGLYTLIFRRAAKKRKERREGHKGILNRLFGRFTIPDRPVG